MGRMVRVRLAKVPRWRGIDRDTQPADGSDVPYDAETVKALAAGWVDPADGQGTAEADDTEAAAGPIDLDALGAVERPEADDTEAESTNAEVEIVEAEDPPAPTRGASRARGRARKGK